MTAEEIDYNKFAIPFGGRKSHPRKRPQYHLPPIDGNIVLPILPSMYFRLKMVMNL